MPPSVLVLAAFPPELAALPREIPSRAVGIGLSAAAVGAAAALVELRPAVVVLVGTCGVYAPHASSHPVGSCAVARRVSLVEPACAEGKAAFPDPMSLRSDADAALSASLGGPLADVATTLAVTTDDALAERVSVATGCALEHLEAHGVATACAAFGVRFAAVLGVANVVGSTARDEWRRHHRAAGDAAVARVVEWLRATPSLAKPRGSAPSS